MLPMDRLPIIDLSLSDGENSNQVHSALKDIGFLYIVNHGVSAELQTRLSEVAERFFALEETHKKAIAMEKGGLAWRGYFPVKGELTSGVPDLKEGLYFGVEHGDSHPEVKKGTPLHGPNQWPADPEMKVVVLDYMSQMKKVGQNLMGLIALGLGLDRSYFSKRYGDQATELFRIFNYPSPPSLSPQEGSLMGVHEHTDMGFLTILLQDANGGLEVKARESENWISAPPIPGSLVVNIGDMLEFWTHGIYQATLHRVKNTSANNRLSFPYFFDPSWRSKLEPIDSILLQSEELESVPPTTTRKWDGTNLMSLNQDSSYGEFVWNKVRNVFPEL